MSPTPLKGFAPPLVKVRFCLKMSENHAEIAENQVCRSQKYKNFLQEGLIPQTRG